MGAMRRRVYRVTESARVELRRNGQVIDRVYDVGLVVALDEGDVIALDELTALGLASLTTDIKRKTILRKGHTK